MRPALAARTAVSIVVGLLAAAILLVRLHANPAAGADFGQVWYAANQMLAGNDPYTLIGPGHRFAFPFVYPLTAPTLVLPLGLLPELTASIAFAGCSATLLAFALTADGWFRLPLFLSAPYLVALFQVQWSPLLTAGFLLPVLAVVLCAKPNIGTALLVARGSKRHALWAAAGSVVLMILSVLFVPGWPAEWLNALTAGEHLRAPVAHPAGLIVALALCRWKRPEARLILTLACIPQTIAWYETLPLLLVARTFRESLLLALISLLPLVSELMIGRSDGVLNFEPASVAMLIGFTYLPALLLVLRRPNEGEIPAWLDRAIARLQMQRAT